MAKLPATTDAPEGTDPAQAPTPEAPAPASKPPTEADALRAKVETVLANEIEARVRAEIAAEYAAKDAARLQGRTYYTKPGLEAMIDDDLKAVLQSQGVKPEGQGREQMVAKVLEVQDARVGAPERPSGGKQFKVTIHPTETEKGDVEVSVNGFPISIRRGFPVVIGQAYVNALKGAVVETFTLDPEGKKDAEGHTIRVPVRFPRFAVTIEPVE